MECKILKLGGTALNELSECHTASPSPSPPMAMPFSTTLEIIAISGRSRGFCPTCTGAAAVGSPKR